MTYEGASGNTAKEMRDVFGFLENDLERRANIARIYNIFNQDRKYKLKTANALWMQNNFTFLEEFKNVNNEYYGAEIRNLDFMYETEESRKIINKWVEDKTENKIKEILKELDPSTRLVLTNAIYFKGDWEYEFDKEDTTEGDFYTKNTVKKVDFMIQEEKFDYGETEELQILKLGYKGGNMSMLILLPKENFSINNIKLDLDSLEKYRDLDKAKVVVKLPKFKFKQRNILNSILIKMGMRDAFSSSNADFSKMSSKDLHISKIIHQSYIDVNEEGTEAAAATAVIIEISAAELARKEFNANKPFIFLIQEEQTGEILFMGRLNEPVYWE
jgi:serpin B